MKVLKATRERCFYAGLTACKIQRCRRERTLGQGLHAHRAGGAMRLLQQGKSLVQRRFGLGVIAGLVRRFTFLA